MGYNGGSDMGSGVEGGVAKLSTSGFFAKQFFYYLITQNQFSGVGPEQAGTYAINECQQRLSQGFIFAVIGHPWTQYPGLSSITKLYIAQNEEGITIP